MSQVTGALHGNQLAGGDQNAQLLAQAASIGARVDPQTGKWYDLKDGHYIGQQEADQRTKAAGTASTYDRQRAGYLNQVYDRNQQYIDPIAQIAAGLIGGPAAAAAMAAATGYGHTHDLGTAALDAAKSYGGGKLLSLAGNIPGVSSAIDAVKNSGVGQAISNFGDSIANSDFGHAVSDIGSSVGDAGKKLASAFTSGGGGTDANGNATGGGLSTADLLKLIGGGASAYANYQQNQDAMKERAREFDAQLAQNASQYNRTTGDTEATRAANVATAINRAPLADQAQYGLKAAMTNAPTAFQPRDWTQGVQNIRGQATGGPAAQLAANAKAASTYTPGAGGVNTSTLQDLLTKLRASSGLNTATATG